MWAARGRAQRRHVEDFLGPFKHRPDFKSDEAIYRRLIDNGVIDPHFAVLLYAETLSPNRPSETPGDLEQQDVERAEAAMPALEDVGGATE